MSLAVLADHMASKGRGPDSMLIHMSPREVQGLQALAMKHGGSLTINPDTGLPEAGFLDKLLPTILGAGLSLIPGVGPLMAAGIVGGIQTVRTGDIGKGLMAGLGAYGGAGLASGLTAAGESAIGSQAAGQSYLSSSIPSVLEGASPGLTADMAYNLGQAGVDTAGAEASRLAQQAAAERVAAASPFDKFTAGAKAVGENPMNFANKDNLKYLAAAAGPAIMAGMNVQAKGPQTVTKPGMIRPYSYDPYSGGFTAASPYEAAPIRAAEGGLMGMADGGYSPGMLDFTQKSEPVVRMAPGGVAGFAGAYGDPNYVGELTNDYTDAQVAAYIRDNNLSGEKLANAATMFNVTPEQLTRAQGLLAPTAPNAEAVTSASDAYRQAIQANPNAAAANAQTEANMQAVIDAYGNIGRKGIGSTEGTIDQQGYDFWLNALNSGALTKDDLNKQFSSAVNKYITQTPDDKYADYVQNYVVNKYALPTGTAEEFLTGTKSVGLYDQALADALEESKFSLGARYGLTHADIGDPRNVAENYGGLKGVSSNINFYVNDYINNPANSLKTGAEKRADAWQELSKYGLNEDDVVRATGKTIAELFKDAEIKKVIGNTSATSVIPGGFYGNVTNPGDLTRNVDNTVTVHPNIPYRPEGGFSGMGEVKDAYTRGGGSLGYTPYVPTSIEDFNARYNKLTGGSKQAYDYLTGKTPYSPTPYTPTGEVMKPYAESVLGMPANLSKRMYIFDPATKQYKINPDYAIPTYDAKGNKTYNLTNKDVLTYMAAKPAPADFYAWAKANNLTAEQIAAASGMPITEVQKMLTGGAPKDTTASNTDVTEIPANEGGLMAMARGGSTQFDLGDYSDGGRLLRGPGDGVSDSIPASIGNKRPARLADGEFVVPARIVSELGNGSTEAGARKLYAMMDRIQAARRGTVGKGRVAKNSRADKHLPA